MIVFKIVILRKQKKHVISLWQSTKTGSETKKNDLKTKGNLLKPWNFFGHRVNDRYSANTTETHNLIMEIKQNEPQN